MRSKSCCGIDLPFLKAQGFAFPSSVPPPMVSAVDVRMQHTASMCGIRNRSDSE